LFGYDDDFGTFDTLLNVERREGVEFFGKIEIAASSAGDNIEADDESCIKALEMLVSMNTTDWEYLLLPEP